MRKKTIPILIVTMVLALLGIIFIQYAWIKQSFDIQKSLIDHKVHQVVANVDKQLSDHNSLSFITTATEIDSNFIQQILETNTTPPHSSNLNDSIFITYYKDYSSFDSSCIPDTQIEVNVVSTDSAGFNTSYKYRSTTDSLQHITSKINDSIVLMKFNEINFIYERLEQELKRLHFQDGADSTFFKEKLSIESTTMGLKKPTNWAIYNRIDKQYAIQPKTEQNWDYKIPILKNDLIYSNQYILFLNMEDSNTVIWKKIALMIVLSIVFIAIIILVFIYSIRLVIKHKKISEIKSDFINNMTHEFKTPLASISLAADSILHPKITPNPEKVAKYIGIIKAEKTKLNQHIETILEVASLQENKMSIALEKVNLSQAIDQSLKKLALLIENRMSNINVEIDSDIDIKSNAYHLENILSNIIENSIKYSTKNPVLFISTHKKENKIQLKIRDEGIGMSKEQISKAFDNFYRAQKGNIHNTKGFGLGLSFVKSMVLKMDGAVEIESELNKGTTVLLEFPLWH